MVRDLGTGYLLLTNVGFVAGTLVTAAVFSKSKLTFNVAFDKAWYITIGFWMAVATFRGWL
jgi:hypothetical protein